MTLIIILSVDYETWKGKDSQKKLLRIGNELSNPILNVNSKGTQHGGRRWK